MSETLKNLFKAFVGESQARNKYSFYAKIAMKEGYHQIFDMFLLTAENEKEHAKWLLRMINGLSGKSDEVVNIDSDIGTVLGDTISNLKSAVEGEHYETSEMYPNFADVASKEGYSEIAVRLRAIGQAEKHHEERYKKLLKELEDGTLLKKSDKVFWVCRKCGYVHEGFEPPLKCPSCDHPKEYFEIKCEVY